MQHSGRLPLKKLEPDEEALLRLLQRWRHSRPAMPPDTAEAFPLPADIPTAAEKVGRCAPSKLPSPIPGDPEARLWRVPGIPGTEPA
jgi:hypothetical protein